MAKKLLFLCTGNYYRSRFAEILFDKIASEKGLDWRVDSRGLLNNIHTRNPGPISPHALQGLAERGIHLDGAQRFPLEVEERDLVAADRVIALKEAEHRALLAERFAGWEDRVEYWHVHDLDAAPAEQALAELESEVVALAERFSQDSEGRF